MDGLLPSPPLGSADLRIPYINIFESWYSPGSFKNLACVRRTGQVEGRVNLEQVLSRSLEEETTSLLQAWLFFGLISEFFGWQVSTWKYLQNDGTDAKVVVFNQALALDLLHQWKGQLSRMSRFDVQARRAYVAGLLTFATDQSDLFDGSPNHSATSSLALVALSVKLLITALRSISEVCFDAAAKHERNAMFQYFPKMGLLSSRISVDKLGNNEGSVLVPLPPGGTDSLSTKALLERFNDNGWCPCRARYLCQLYDFSIVNYMSRIKRPASENATHERCKTQTKCIAYNLTVKQMRDYQPQHTEMGCQCRHVRIKESALTRVIEMGKIPIISIDPESSDDTMDLRMHINNGTLPYTAISHVWSDGLGNPKDNSLPRCQLQRLANVLSKLKQERRSQTLIIERWSSWGVMIKKAEKRRVYFWMDTLCIPARIIAGASPSMDLKLKAIKQITPIFSVAEQVLVLDSELETLQPVMTTQGLLDEEELAARILGCKWLDRAWTLEEGSLARVCCFKLQGNRTITFAPRPKTGSSWMSFRSQKESLYDQAVGLKQPVKNILFGILNEERKQAMRAGVGRNGFKAIEKSRASQFVDAWNDLLYRSATKPKDSLIIFANILDFNAGSIGRLPVEDRLATVIRSCRELPTSILYNTGNVPQPNVHPRDAWIPTRVKGDRLVKGAVMTRWESVDKHIVGLEIKTNDSAPGSLVVLLTTEWVPLQNHLFHLLDIPTGEEYIIETPSPPTSLSSFQQGHISRLNASTCILIDKATGSQSRNGYTGRGARLSTWDSDGAEILVRFEASITAWSVDQWRARNQTSALPQHIIGANSPRSNQHIILECDEPQWEKPYRQRPILSPPPRNPALIHLVITLGPAFALMFSLTELVGPCRLSPTENIDGKVFFNCLVARLVVIVILIVTLSPLVLFIRFLWIRRNLNAWLTTFEDNWAPAPVGLLGARMRMFARRYAAVLMCRRIGRKRDQRDEVGNDFDIDFDIAQNGRYAELP